MFNEHDDDFLCLTGGTDSKLKLWDLRQLRCIRDYGNDEENPSLFHSNSIWSICPTSTFESCFTGGKDGAIFHTDLVGDFHTKLYQVPGSPITSLCFDEENLKLWFSSGIDSSLKCLDLTKRSLDNSISENPNKISLKQADYELEGLPWITEYHMLKNKRYIITKNSQNLCQVWNIDQAKLIKTYQSKSFDQVVKMMDSRYDL